VQEEPDEQLTEEDVGVDWEKVDFSKSKPRKLKREFSSSAVLCVEFSIPVVICLVYFILAQLSAQIADRQIRVDQTAILFSEQRHAAAQAVQLEVAQALLATSQVVAATHAGNATVSITRMLALEEELYLGSSGFDGSLHTNGDERQLMLTNGCWGSASLSACNAVMGGVFSRGLHAVIQVYSDLAASVLEKRLGPGSSWTLSRRFADPDWQTLEQLAVQVNAALETATAFRENYVSSQNASYKQLTNTVGSCFILLVFLSFLFVYVPMIGRLDAMLKRTRNMLLLFPDEVIAGVAAVKELFSKYSKSFAYS